MRRTTRETTTPEHDPVLARLLTAPTDRVRLLDGGGEAYPRMLLSIDSASRRIHFEVYAFSDRGVGAVFVAALARAAKRGVRVDVTLDGVGSAARGRSVVAELRRAGCDARIHNRLAAMFFGRLTRNHRKVLLVDDEVAFLGGINVGDENVSDDARRGWADVAVEIRGPSCAHLGERVRGEPLRAHSGPVHVVLSEAGGGRKLQRRYLDLFARARRRICVAHGYFLPTRAVVSALVAAARRGVEVTLLLAGVSDVPFARAATRSLYRTLLGAGVRIHEWHDSILHAKLATADGERLLVGSFNLDPFSLVNLESLVCVDDAALVARAEEWFDVHVASARAVTEATTAAWVCRFFFDPFGRFVARVAESFARAVGHGRPRRRARAPALRATGS